MGNINRIVKYLLLLLGLLFVQTSRCFSVNQERYLHFTEVDGLPRNSATCLAKDQYGYVWIGTSNGIARFDGKNFKVYNELENCATNSLLYDTNNNLWVSCSNGLYKYNRVTDYFELIINGYIYGIEEDRGDVYFLMMWDICRINGKDIDKIMHVENITSFCFSDDGLWISKNNDGVLLFDRVTNFSQVKASFLKNFKVAKISKINNELFAGMYDGQLFTISKDYKIRKIELNNHYYILACKKVGDQIWIATDGNGIFILDQNLNLLKKLDRNEGSSSSISSNSIYDILIGENKEIWLATYGSGLTCILPDNRLFQNILPEKGNENSLVANDGVSVFVKEPYVYFGTNYGLSQWNKNLNWFKNLSRKKLQDELKGTKVTAIYVDSDNTLWVGTYDGLLGHYTSDFKLIRYYHPCSQLPDEMQRIIDIKEYNKDNLAILTQFHSQILLNFNKATGQTAIFELYQKGSNNTYCLLNCLRTNKRGELLAVITDLGLFHVNCNDKVLENRLSEMNAKLDCYITDFYNDKSGNYWITSSTDGLLFATPDGKVLKKWTEKDGLPSNKMIRIESTDDRYLWISTISGICRFDTRTMEVLNFNHRDGLPANEFHDRVSTIINDGRVIFGSLAGFTIIDPSKVEQDASQPEVVISDITFQNQSIRHADGEQIITQPLEETKEISLPYDKNSFSIHYFTRNKSFSQYQNYEYRLLGLEENWTYQGETNYTTYTNLSSGKYVFEIRNADKNQPGVTTRLTIKIQSPWYFTLYAYLFYIVIFFTILYLSIYAFLKRFELLKEKEIGEIKIQKEHELTERKLAFFTNISHDLKTPLTLIDAPVTDLLNRKNLDQEEAEKLHIIRRNSKRLYKLISDLLDFRIITQKQSILEIKETNINHLMSEITDAFIEECKNKSVELINNSGINLIGFIDVQKMEKILWNLLSNALKFTPKGGSILIDADEFIFSGLRHLKLVVKDDGIGISKEDQKKIFDRFYQVNHTKNGNQEGTGIGLSIVKELIEMHHGKIEVDSELGQGTTFTILIPIDPIAYNETEFASAPLFSELSESEDIKATRESIHYLRYNLQRMLIVEDNTELREYLAKHFEKLFKVYSAEDGFAGLKLAKENNPELILTDVQMPNMNGYEFCKAIRSSFETSHIPVVMLTANNTIDQQIEGLSTGADVYLTKPFDINLLDAHINSLLENRKSLRKKFMGMEQDVDIEKTIPQRDIDFINDLRLFIEENIMNPDLNVEFLSKHFSISLAQLHRKIKALTDSTPNNMIKSIRLRIAYKLIKKDGLRVSEVADLTGFSDPSYFARCFKNEFGENPSQIG
jgi:signal transduction histidine kinase/DNA-binding response OmpR family regulator/ligand-binding sensor domain-containing protein